MCQGPIIIHLKHLDKPRFETANSLQGRLQLLIVPQPRAYLGGLFSAKTDLAGPPTRVANGKDPDRVPLAATTLGITLATADHARQQRATQDLAQVGKVAEKAITSPNNLLVFEPLLSTLFLMSPLKWFGGRASAAIWNGLTRSLPGSR